MSAVDHLPTDAARQRDTRWVDDLSIPPFVLTTADAEGMEPGSVVSVSVPLPSGHELALSLMRHRDGRWAVLTRAGVGSEVIAGLDARYKRRVYATSGRPAPLRAEMVPGREPSDDGNNARVVTFADAAARIRGARP